MEPQKAPMPMGKMAGWRVTTISTKDAAEKKGNEVTLHVATGGRNCPELVKRLLLSYQLNKIAEESDLVKAGTFTQPFPLFITANTDPPSKNPDIDLQLYYSGNAESKTQLPLRVDTLIFCFLATDGAGLENIVRRRAKQLLSAHPQAVMVLVAFDAHKRGLAWTDNTVPEERAKALAAKLEKYTKAPVPYFEVDFETGDHIKEVFHAAIENALTRKFNPKKTILHKVGIKKQKEKKFVAKSCRVDLKRTPKPNLPNNSLFVQNNKQNQEIYQDNQEQDEDDEEEEEQDELNLN